MRVVSDDLNPGLWQLTSVVLAGAGGDGGLTGSVFLSQHLRLGGFWVHWGVLGAFGVGQWLSVMDVVRC